MKIGCEKMLKNIKITNLGKMDEYNKVRKNHPLYQNLLKVRRQMVIDDYNKDIEQMISINGNPFSEKVAEEFKQINVLDFFLKKGNYIAQKMNKFADVIGLKSGLEIGMLPIGEKDNNVLSEIYIPREQKVSNAYCEITGYGNLMSLKSIKKKLNMDLKAWSHSHGLMEPFHSGIDNNTIRNYTNWHGKIKRINLLEDCGEELYVNVKYFPSIVFNGLNSKPYAVLCMEYQKFNETEKTYIQNVAEINEIQDTSKKEIETESIENQLLESVSIIGKGSLKELYGVNKDEIKEMNPKRIEQPKVLESSDLAQRVREIEINYIKLTDDFASMENKYFQLENKYSLLESKVSNAESGINRLYSKFKKMLKK